MSDTQASLRRKIDGAAKLGSVVRTMKAVAASSIAQYEAAVGALADYERSVEFGLAVSFRQGWRVATAPRQKGGVGKIGAIVFGSDQGLVGQFNEAMAEFAMATLASLPGEKKIWAVGERIGARLTEANFPLAGRLAVPGSVAAITPLVGQLQLASEAQGDDGCAEVYVFHTRPKSGAQCEPVYPTVTAAGSAVGKRSRENQMADQEPARIIWPG